jgi:hypothetical protein
MLCDVNVQRCARKQRSGKRGDEFQEYEHCCSNVPAPPQRATTDHRPPVPDIMRSHKD